ncbi:colanic acid biosynthesis glycosyltransferase WcaL [Tenacibaculum sp. KUL118]|nr:colanic acid biosynthesis glycosyltransferase WcaL [Tenacibaculum sp. KUL118]
MREFPVLSETFVVNQVLEMARKGFDVKVLSVNPICKDERVYGELFCQDNLKIELISLFTKKHGKKSYLIMLLGLLYCLKKVERYGLAKLFFTFVKKRDFFLAKDLMCIVWSAKGLNISVDNCIAHFGNNGVVFDHLVKGNLIKCKHLFTVFHGFEISKHEQIKSWGQLYQTLSGTLLPISDLWSRKLQALGVNPKKIEVLHMGVDVDRFSFKPRILKTPPIILSVARATEKKGLLYAIEGVLNCDVECELRIIGDGSLLPSLKDVAATHKNSYRIKFLGAQSSEFVLEALDESDIFLLPSITDRDGDMEGIPVSLMEAMSRGVPVLSTYHSGIPELITDGVNGYLVKEKDSKGISEKLEMIIKNENNIHLKKNARHTVETDFNSKKLSERLSLLLEAKNV